MKRKPTPASPATRRLPSRPVRISLATLLLLGLGVRLGNPLGDHAMANMLAILCGTLALIVLGLWFLCCRAYRLRTRLGVLGALIAVGALGASLFRVEQVSGELIPSFALRWGGPRHARVTVVPEPNGPADANLGATTPDDFPQFLGPQRSAWIPARALATDWDARAPRCLWRRPVGAGWSAFAAVNGFAVTLEQAGNREAVVCYEIATGRRVWVHAYPAHHETVAGGLGPRGTPTIADGRVYALGATGHLVCLAGTTGTPIWDVNLVPDPDADLREVAWGRAASPLVVDGRVVVPVGGPPGGPYVSLAAFDALAGDRLWEAGDRQVSYASPSLVTLGGRRQILSVNENNVSAHDPNTGAVLWQYDWAGDSSSRPSVSQAVALDDERVLLSKGYGRGAELLRVRAAEAGGYDVTELWRTRRVLKTKFTNAVVRGDLAYALSDGVLECADLRDGTRRWRGARYGHGQVLGVGDLLLVQAERGGVALVAADPERFTERTRFAALDGKTWTTPCLAGHHLLVRNATEAACYELPAAP